MPVLSNLHEFGSTPFISSFSSRMPALVRALYRRDGFQLQTPPAGTNLSKNTIIYLVCLGLIPLIVIICVVVWALCFYGRNRACCCCCARRKDSNEHDLLKIEGRNNGNGSEVSEDIIMKELSARRMAMHHSTRHGPWQRTAAMGDSKLASILQEEHAGRAPSLRRFV
jgi:hypothetical protein